MYELSKHCLIMAVDALQQFQINYNPPRRSRWQKGLFMYKSQTQFIIVKKNNVLEKVGTSFVYVLKSAFKKGKNDIKWYPEVFKNK